MQAGRQLQGRQNFPVRAHLLALGHSIKSRSTSLRSRSGQAMAAANRCCVDRYDSFISKLLPWARVLPEAS